MKKEGKKDDCLPFSRVGEVVDCVLILSFSAPPQSMSKTILSFCAENKSEKQF